MANELPDEPGIREAKSHFSDYVNRVIYRGDLVWIRKNDKRVTALVPADVGEWLEANADAVRVSMALAAERAGSGD